MANDNTDLLIQPISTFDEWRQKFNELATRSSSMNTVGELQNLDPGITGVNRNSVIAALNFVFQQRISEGQPLENSSFTNCFVPAGTGLFFGGDDDFEMSGTTTTLTLKNAAVNVFHYDLTSGNFGLGTVTPEEKLDVNGTGRFHTVEVKNPVNQLGVSVENIPVGARRLTVVESDSPLHLNRGTQPIVLAAGGGKVGVGYDDESTMTETFSVNSASSTTSTAIQTLNTKITTTVDFTGIHYKKDANEFMTVNNSGQIGIGNDSPSYELDVSGGTYSDDITFGSTLQAGSTTIVTVTVEGYTNFSLAAGSQLTHGGNVLINSSGKVTALALSNITTSDISEGGVNKYLTISNLNTLLGSNPVNSFSIKNTGTLVHGTTTIVGTDSKIPGSVLNANTDHISEGTTNKYLSTPNLNSVLDANQVNRVRIKNTGTLIHGTTTIVGTDSKIPGSVLDADTDDVSEGTNLYFTDARARTAVGGGTVTNVTVSNLVNLPKHATGSRPTASEGAMIYDSTLKLPIFYDGTNWKDFAGNIV